MYFLGIVVQYFAGANMSLIYGMVPDTIEYSELITKGERMDGFLNTLSSFWNKVGITIGTAGTVWILDLVGYVPNAADQPSNVILALDLMKWILPTIFWHHRPCLADLVQTGLRELRQAGRHPQRTAPGLGGRTQSRRREVTPSGRRKRRISNVSIRRAAL